MNNKGFTLIEVLATISILVLITLIAVPSIVSMKDRQNTRSSDEIKKIVENSAETYYEIYKGKIKNKDKINSEGLCISVKRLIESRMLKKPDEIDINNAYVRIKKNGENIEYGFGECSGENIEFKE